jgi:hypothetical protein
LGSIDLFFAYYFERRGLSANVIWGENMKKNKGKGGTTKGKKRKYIKGTGRSKWTGKKLK